jgi:acyl carrier protein
MTVQNYRALASVYPTEKSMSSPLSLQQTDILKRLKEIASGKVPVDIARFSPEARLSDIGLDSFSLIELVFLAEEEFGIRIPVEGLTVNTVGDVLDVISQRISTPNLC